MTTHPLTLDDNDDPTLSSVLDEARLALGCLADALEELHAIKRLVTDDGDVLAAIDRVSLAWAETAQAVGAIKEAGTRPEPPRTPDGHLIPSVDDRPYTPPRMSYL